MEEQEMVPGSGCKVPQYQTCQRGLWATTIASTTLRNMAERLPCIQYFCVNITVGLLDSREVFCLLFLLFLTRLLLLMGWFILFRCQLFLFHCNVWTGQLLVSNSLRSLSILFHQQQEAEGMNTSYQEWKTLLLKVISLGTNCSNVSLETLWELYLLN